MTAHDTSRRKKLRADGGHVGPIIFANRTARSQLLNEGTVVTFRTRDRTTGDTWWRTSRTGEKKSDVTVERIGAADPIREDLAPFADESGFTSWNAWQDAIHDVHGDDVSGYLFRATAAKGECGKCGDVDHLPTNRFCPSCEREEAHDLYQSRTPPR